MSLNIPPSQNLIQTLVHRFSVFPQVEALGLGGSRISPTTDTYADIDLYVYTTSVIPLQNRAALVETFKPTRVDLDMQAWDLCDEWCDAKTGIEVDAIYWDTHWIEEQLDRVLEKHQAGTGYTTCFWYTIRHSHILFDRNGWFHALKQKSDKSYPETLRRSIIAKNHPLLRRAIESYLHQIEKAIKRRDLVSINHRITGLFASYFDIIFALNHVLHPGEKRLVELANQRCPKIPKHMPHQVEHVLQAACRIDKTLIKKIELLINSLDRLLTEEGFGPNGKHI